MTLTANGYDLAIVGSGGGAFAAAIAARRKGRSVVMVESGTIGGTCVNTGCVPSKALLAAAEARHIAAHQAFPGVTTHAYPVDAPALFGGVHDLVRGLRADKYVDLAAEHGWRILPGRARFVDGPALHVALTDGRSLRVHAEHYLIATGSAPVAPPIDGLTEAGYLTSTTALELAAVPPSLLVLGGGPVGLELAQLFARLGSRVTVIARTRLASREEPEIAAGIEQIFTEEGITVHTNTRTRRVTRSADGHLAATVIGPDGHAQQLTADELLVATGRRPVSGGLGLDRVGVKVADGGQILVDEHLRTSNPRIWAAGDVTGGPQYVYVAAAHGTLVADNALDDANRTLIYRHLPRVTFTSPAIASAGLTEAQAREHGYTAQSRVLPLQYVPRAVVNRDTRGLIKLVADQNTGRLLGAHILADAAGDIIATAVHALANHTTVQQLADQWCPYLSMAEGLKLAAQTFTRDITTLSCCAS